MKIRSCEVLAYWRNTLRTRSTITFLEILNNDIISLKHTESLNLEWTHVSVWRFHAWIRFFWYAFFQWCTEYMARVVLCMSGLCSAYCCSHWLKYGWCRQQKTYVFARAINISRLLLWEKWLHCTVKTDGNIKQETVLWGFWSLYKIWNVRKCEGCPSRQRKAAVRSTCLSLAVCSLSHLDTN